MGRTISVIVALGVAVILSTLVLVNLLPGPTTSPKTPSATSTSTVPSTAYGGFQHFAGKIFVPLQDSPLLYDNNSEKITINASNVGATLTAKWNSGLGSYATSAGPAQSMIVSLKEGKTTLVTASESTKLTPAWVIRGYNSSKVAEVVYYKNGSVTDLYPKNASLIGNRVDLDGETLLHPELRHLGVFYAYDTVQSYLGYSWVYNAATFNETSVGWTYVFNHPGNYDLSYRFTKDLLRQAGSMYNPILDGMILISLQQNGLTTWEKLSTFVTGAVAMGSWIQPFMGLRLDHQYILFPQGSGQVTFQVSWNASGTVAMWVSQLTLTGALMNNYPGPTGTRGRLTLSSTPSVYWLIFFTDDSDFVDGGLIQFDVQYPAGVSVVTYFA